MKNITIKDIGNASNKWIYGKALARGYILFLILFLLGALIVTYTDVDERVVPILSSIIMIIGIAYTSIYTAVHVKTKGWAHGALVAIIYIFILILLSKLFVANYIAITRTMFYKVCIAIITGVIGGIIGINMK